MTDYVHPVQALIDEATELHKLEKKITLQSTLLVGQLERDRASVLCGLTSADFARRIGLSPDQYWKRAQAARLFMFFPEVREMVERDEICVSAVSMLTPRLTEANKDILLEGVKGKSKREIAELLSVVTDDGQILEREPTVELKLTLTKSQMAKLDRAFDVLAAGGQNPSMNEVLEKALDELLWRRDPMKKAERARIREQKKEVAEHLSNAPAPAQKDMAGSGPVSAPGQEHFSSAPAQELRRPAPGQERRPHIPAATSHRVWLRDRGQCTWKHSDGSRCHERKMLEIDHIHMYCRGGTDATENLTLRCRFHNQVAAEQVLGRAFMERKRFSG